MSQVQSPLTATNSGLAVNNNTMNSQMPNRSNVRLVNGTLPPSLRFSSNTNQNSYEVLGRAFGPQFFVGFS